MIYDSNCPLCESSVHWIIKNDKNKHFKFLSAHSRLGKNYLQKYNLDPDDLETVTLIRNDIAYIKSDAVLETAKELDGSWKLFYIFKIIPRFLRDKIYMYVSKNRFKLFGEKEKCILSEDEIKDRFI